MKNGAVGSCGISGGILSLLQCMLAPALTLPTTTHPVSCPACKSYCEDRPAGARTPSALSSLSRCQVSASCGLSRGEWQSSLPQLSDRLLWRSALQWTGVIYHPQPSAALLRNDLVRHCCSTALDGRLQLGPFASDCWAMCNTVHLRGTCVRSPSSIVQCTKVVSRSLRSGLPICSTTNLAGPIGCNPLQHHAAQAPADKLEADQGSMAPEQSSRRGCTARQLFPGCGCHRSGDRRLFMHWLQT